jgi:hypothetical protein
MMMVRIVRNARNVSLSTAWTRVPGPLRPHVRKHRRPPRRRPCGRPETPRTRLRTRSVGSPGIIEQSACRRFHTAPPAASHAQMHDLSTEPPTDCRSCPPRCDRASGARSGSVHRNAAWCPSSKGPSTWEHVACPHPPRRSRRARVSHLQAWACRRLRVHAESRTLPPRSSSVYRVPYPRLRGRARPW